MAAKKEQTPNRLPPQDVDAERSVLGSILLDKNSIFRVVDILNPADFYLDTHGILYKEMVELSEKRQPLDIVSVASRLKDKGLLAEVGGESYLTKLVNSVPSAAHVAHYASVVQKKSILRKLIEASYEIAQIGYNESEDVDILIDEAEKRIFTISQHANTQNFLEIKSALEEAFERIDRLHKNTGEVRGIPTGFPDLDNILSGLQKSDLVILAARPSLGKSSLALDIARNAATKTKTPVGIFSLEMSKDQIVDRFIASEAGIDLWKLRTGNLSSHGDNNDFVKIQRAMGTLSEAPVFIDDGTSSSVLQMRAMARRLQAEHGLGLVVVDYLQLIQPRMSTDNMVQQITEISRSLKALARELNVPVLALSQLSRAVEQRTSPIPKLSDLRDSGSIEQDADVVMFIYRDLSKRGEDPEREAFAEIHIAKHRNGPTGKINLYFERRSASFRSMAKRQDVPEPPEEGFPDDVGIEDIPS